MPSIKLVIERAEDGRINVVGPIQDKILAYGLLESARDTIKDWHAARAKEASEQRVTPVTEIPSNLVPFNDGGRV